MIIGATYIKYLSKIKLISYEIIDKNRDEYSLKMVEKFKGCYEAWNIKDASGHEEDIQNEFSNERIIVSKYKVYFEIGDRYKLEDEINQVSFRVKSKIREDKINLIIQTND